MELNGEYRIPAPRERVWEMLNDPDVLRECIPGCEKLEETDDGFAAIVKAKVGPMNVKMNGTIALEDLNPPASYTLTGEGKGGVAGFAKGGAKVNLAEEGSDTVLRYDAEAKVGGKMAQLGSRLIDSTVKKYADQFFGKFSEMAGEGRVAAGVDAGTRVTGEADTIEHPEAVPLPEGKSEAEPPREPRTTKASEADVVAATHQENLAAPDVPVPNPNITNAPLGTPPLVDTGEDEARPPADGAAARPGFMGVQGPLLWGLVALGVLILLLLVF